MTDNGARKDERPAAFVQFINRFPKLRKAWDMMRETEAEAGPRDEKTRRLVKLAIAAAREAEGATHSAVSRRARRGSRSRKWSRSWLSRPARWDCRTPSRSIAGSTRLASETFWMRQPPPPSSW